MAQLAAFTQSLTAQAIVRAADREAGSPGLYLNDAGSETLTAPAYVKLQAILDHEGLTSHWPWKMDATSVQVTGRTTSLPSDFWNASFDEAYWLHPTTGERTPLPLLDRRAFHEQLTPAGQQDAPPEVACIIKNQGSANGGASPTGVLMVQPVWSTHYWVELHYCPISVPLAAISSKPWLPSSLYLIKKLAVELYSEQDDARAVQAAAFAAALKSELLDGSADPGQRTKRSRLGSVFQPPVRI